MAAWNGKSARCYHFSAHSNSSAVSSTRSGLDRVRRRSGAPHASACDVTARGLECLYLNGNDEFVVHETFLGATGRSGIYRVARKAVPPELVDAADHGHHRLQCLAHRAGSAPGERVLCDTNHPDLGIHIIKVADGSRSLVCRSDSSNRGSQWLTSRYAHQGGFRARPGGARKFV